MNTMFAALLAALFAAGIAHGGTAFAASTGSSPAGAGEDAAAQRAPATVEGFRSAKFGMTEEELRKAIRSDFGSKDTDIERSENPVERTTSLSVTVKDLLPGGGPARVSYILGYSSKKLIHVNVLWAHDLGATTNETLLANATTLQAYLSDQPFPPAGVAMNAALPDGSVLLFRATDAKARAVLLVVSGLARPAEAAKEGAAKEGAAKTASAKAGDKAPDKAAESKPVVRLSYIANPADPDIFRVKPGQF